MRLVMLIIYIIQYNIKFNIIQKMEFLFLLILLLKNLKFKYHLISQKYHITCLSFANFKYQ